MKITDWIKRKLDLNPDPSLSFQEPQLEEEDLEEEASGPPVVSLRFKVTVRGEQGKVDRVLFVYGRDEADARSRLPEALVATATLEPAGHAEDGVVHFPPEEIREVMASMQDGRRAPGA